MKKSTEHTLRKGILQVPGHFGSRYLKQKKKGKVSKRIPKKKKKTILNQILQHKFPQRIISQDNSHCEILALML